MPDDAKKITIELKIAIPYDGQPPEVSQTIGDTPQPGRERRPQPGETYGIFYPEPDKPWPVKVLSGTSGIICALGKATISQGQYPATVVGGCYPPNNVPSNPLGGVHEDSGSVDATTGQWTLWSVPAQCAPSSPGQYQILKVWFYETCKATDAIQTETVAFYGYCAQSTYCEDIARRDPLAGSSRRVVLPTRLLVSASGFSPQLADFNQDWELTIEPAASESQEVIWRNDSSCPKEPRVELIGDTHAFSARLVFQQQATTVEFLKQAGDWNPMNVADFSDARSHATPPGASIPAIVSVRPA